jgi:hypothetical protein
MWFLLEEGRFHNVFEDKPAKWSIAKNKKKKPSKYTPTTNSYDFARRSGHKKYIIKLSIK